MHLQILNKYLVQHKSLPIPGLGALVVEEVPAVNDFTNRQIHAVQKKIRFDNYFDSPDREFFTYLGEERKIPEFEAIRWYNEFAFNLRQQIRTDGEAEWKGIGVFKRLASGDIQFEPEASGYQLFRPVTAERVVRQTMDHAIIVGDQEKTTGQMVAFLSEDGPTHETIKKANWWIGVVIAIIVAALVALLYFFTEGFSDWSFFK
jgi:hypothetical protein